jgi:hypothetical protein
MNGVLINILDVLKLKRWKDDKELRPVRSAYISYDFFLKKNEKRKRERDSLPCGGEPEKENKDVLLRQK